MTVDVHSVPEPQREALLHWTNASQFQLLLAVVRSRIAVAVEEQVRLTLANADQVLREGVQTPGFDRASREAARWQLIHDGLLGLQADIADLSKSLLVGSKIEV